MRLGAKIFAVTAGLVAMVVVVTELIVSRIDKHGVPMEQAVTAAEVFARKTWRHNFQLQFVTSQDSDADIQDVEVPGLDGRRRAWAVQLVDPGTSEAIVVQVINGKATEILATAVDQKPGLDLSEFHVLGKELTRAGIDAGLLPGKGWAVGYHFRFSYDFATNTHNVEVMGLDNVGKRKTLVFDPTTGNLR